VALTFEAVEWNPLIFSVTIYVKAIKQFILVTLLIMFYKIKQKMGLTFESVNEILKCMAIRMKATEQYF